MKPNNHSEDSPRAGIRVHPLYIILLVAVNLVVIMVLGWPRVQERLPSFRTETPSPTVTVTPSPTLTRTLTPSPTDGYRLPLPHPGIRRHALPLHL